jgi:hypothetical protein
LHSGDRRPPGRSRFVSASEILIADLDGDGELDLVISLEESLGGDEGV